MKALDRIRHYYNVMGDLSHTNLVLKISLTVVGIALVFSLIVITRLALRPPLIITILPEGSAIPTAYESDNESTATAAECQRFINEFLSFKYNWAPTTVESQLKKAVSFLDNDLKQEIQKKISEDIVYVKNTAMTQHLYVKEIAATDSKPFKLKKEYAVTGDRVIGINGAKFTTNFKLVLTLQKKKRTPKNLSGLEIIKLQETLSKEKK